MTSSILSVKQHYDKNYKKEWKRLKQNPFEFIFTTYIMDKHVKPNDKVLDLGGGPGRYSIYYAQKGCDVTLVDLSEGNISYARKMAKKAKVQIKTSVCNCLALDSLNLGEFDHVFLMGPLYHLIDEKERINAVNIALKHLKKGGILYATFIMLFAGMIYDLKNAGHIAKDYKHPEIKKLFDCLEDESEYTGPAFTKACFYHPKKIPQFMQQFDLMQMHLFGQESFLAPLSNSILRRKKDEIATWIELGKRFIENPDLLVYSEHAMYIGSKTNKD